MDSPSQEQPDTDGLLDALVEIARHVRLLVLLPMAVAALVTGIFYLMPTFVSRAIISIPSDAPARYGSRNLSPSLAVVMLKAPAVVDHVLAASRRGAAPASGTDREALLKRIQVGLVRANDVHIQLEVRSTIGTDAQATANILIDAWLQTLAPPPRQMAEMLILRAHAKAAMAETQALLDLRKGALASMEGLGDILDRYVVQLVEIDRAIAGPGRELVVLAPTLPDEPERVPHFAIFFKTYLAAAVLLVLGILVRMVLRDPAKASRLKQIWASIHTLRKQRPRASP